MSNGRISSTKNAELGFARHPAARLFFSFIFLTDFFVFFKTLEAFKNEHIFIKIHFHTCEIHIKFSDSERGGRLPLLSHFLVFFQT